PLCNVPEEMTVPAEELTNKPFAAQLSNVYFSILALFCFKLFVKISLNLLAYFYIVRGNRKEAARISAEFYDYGQQHIITESYCCRRILGGPLTPPRCCESGPPPGSEDPHFTGEENNPTSPPPQKGEVYVHILVCAHKGHSVNVLTIDHVTPLHEACVGDHVACARALIDAGANVNASTIDGVTPLFNACTVGSVACAEILLENGAKPQSLVYHPSPIHEATSKGHYGCVEALVTWGADVDMDIPHLGTALYTACVCQELECARKLLREGANVQKGKSLDSPLHAAAEKDGAAVVKLLLDFGADINARNTDFQRPVDVAPPSSLTEGFLLLYEATPRLLSQLCRQRIRDCIFICRFARAQSSMSPKHTGLQREVLKWLQSLDLSFYPNNVRRDFSNGYLVAEIFSRYYPQDFPVHSYDRGTSLPAKQRNWSQIEKSLQKQNLHLMKELVDATIHCKPGAAELLVQEVYMVLTNRSLGDVQCPKLDFTDQEYQQLLPTMARSTASTAIKNNLRITEIMAEPNISTNQKKAEIILQRHLEQKAAERVLNPGRSKMKPNLGQLAAKDFVPPSCDDECLDRPPSSRGTTSNNESEGCLECCIKCLGGIPYPSLIATILLYAGVALFSAAADTRPCPAPSPSSRTTLRWCGALWMLWTSSPLVLFPFSRIDIIKYVIYGIASAFFVYGILLMVEGFFTSGAIKDLYGDFKITTCGRCVSAWFIMLTYIFMLAWLGVTAFTSLPVFIYFNIWNICQNATVLEGATLCLDPRQYGIVPIAEAKTVCAGSEKFYRMCESNELDMTFHLFICALAGAGAAVIAMIHYLMVLSANWAYVKDACRMQKYEDIKSKEEQELHDIHSTRSKERLNAYT
ncbi:hypothetical protein L3Q82_020322, partial [Scortum barcoo]